MHVKIIQYIQTYKIKDIKIKKIMSSLDSAVRLDNRCCTSYNSGIHAEGSAINLPEVKPLRWPHHMPSASRSITRPRSRHECASRYMKDWVLLRHRVADVPGLSFIENHRITLNKYKQMFWNILHLLIAYSTMDRC